MTLKTGSLEEPVNPLITSLLDDLDVLNDLDLSESSKVCPYQLITSVKQVELLVRDNRIHPEVFGLMEYPFNLMGTINYGPVRFRLDTAQSEKLREDLIRQLMGRVRMGLGLRGKDFWWVATTEYGYENRIHSHFLAGIPVNKGFTVEDLSSAVEQAFTALSGIFQEPVLGTIHLEPVTNPMGAAAYLCKEEYRRPMKHFTYSQSLVKT